MNDLRSAIIEILSDGVARDVYEITAQCRERGFVSQHICDDVCKIIVNGEGQSFVSRIDSFTSEGLRAWALTFDATVRLETDGNSMEIEKDRNGIKRRN